MANDSLVQTTPAAVVPIIRQQQEQRQQLSPYSNSASFEAARSMARQLASSSLVPQAFRKDESNCLIAMELASRIGVSVLAVMQNLDIIQGKPGWSAKFLIATVNATGRFTPLRFEWSGKEGTDSWACRCVAKDRTYGDVCEGAWITWSMANKEGWTSKSGSKWKTMPQQMFMYRAAAFWVRTYCPEVSVGFQTTEELVDTSDGRVRASGSVLPEVLAPAGAKALEAVLGLQNDAPEPEQHVDEATGQVLQHPNLKFGKRFGGPDADQPFETGSSERRQKYIDDLDAALLEKHDPRVQKHRDDCSEVHLALIAEAQMGEGA